MEIRKSSRKQNLGLIYNVTFCNANSGPQYFLGLGRQNVMENIIIRGINLEVSCVSDYLS